MIRGNIEVVTHEVVQGWIYSSDGSTRNIMVLAFSGAECVGGGKVDVFRSDLADAGLGDGYLGFSFGVTIDPKNVGSITVKLDGSDAVLLQQKAVVTSEAAMAAIVATISEFNGFEPMHAEAPNLVAREPGVLDHIAVQKQVAALTWQLKNARLSQADHDYLLILWSFGIYERTLLRRLEVGKAAVAEPAATVAAQLLESYLGADAHLTTLTGITATKFQAELDKVAADPGLAPIVALCSTDRVGIRALQGSHVTETPGFGDEPRRAKYVDYSINPDKLVILDCRATAELYTAAGQTVSLVTAGASFA